MWGPTFGNMDLLNGKRQPATRKDISMKLDVSSDKVALSVKWVVDTGNEKSKR